MLLLLIGVAPVAIRGKRPLIKSIEESYHFASGIYDDPDGIYDTLDTYDGTEELQPTDSRFQIVAVDSRFAPKIKSIQTTYRFTSAIYDEISAYDDTDSYDGSEEVQMSAGLIIRVKDIQ